MLTDKSDMVGSRMGPESLPQKMPFMKGILLLVTALVMLGVSALVPAGPKENMWLPIVALVPPARALC